MRKFQIGKKKIGPLEPCFITAEIGSNHNQNLELTKKLVGVIKEAGADAVKFQSFTTENLVSRRITSFPTLSSNGDPFKILKRCELSYSMYAKIKEFAETRGLICFSSPSHKTDVDELNRIGVPAFKISSAQITDLPIIKYIAAKGKPVILSTGAATLQEISEAVEIIKSTDNEQIVLLHCTMLYPTKLNQVNLAAIETLRANFPDVIIGYSDHTMEPVLIPVAAVAMGAHVIEKHITLDRSMPGPDHPFALEPKEFEAMVRAIRILEKAVGNPKKQPLAAEKVIAQASRRSLVIVRPIKKGQKIRETEITTKRPGDGIPPKFLPSIIGRIARVDLKSDDILSWDNVETGN